MGKRKGAAPPEQESAFADMHEPRTVEEMTRLFSEEGVEIDVDLIRGIYEHARLEQMSLVTLSAVLIRAGIGGVR